MLTVDLAQIRHEEGILVSSGTRVVIDSLDMLLQSLCYQPLSNPISISSYIRMVNTEVLSNFGRNWCIIFECNSSRRCHAPAASTLGCEW